jgi:hypothetical protein
MESTKLLPTAGQKLPQYSEGYLNIFLVIHIFYLLHDVLLNPWVPRKTGWEILVCIFWVRFEPGSPKYKPRTL